MTARTPARTTEDHPMHPTRRTTLTLLAAAAAPWLAHAQPAAAWPTKPIRLVVPLAAGMLRLNAVKVYVVSLFSACVWAALYVGIITGISTF